MKNNNRIAKWIRIKFDGEILKSMRILSVFLFHFYDLVSVRIDLFHFRLLSILPM